MDILVTGVSGFIGSNIADYLHKSGYSVIGHCRKIKKKVLYPIYEGDLFNEVSILEQVDCVVHAAGGTPKTCVSEKEFFDSNVRTTKIIIDYMKKYNVKKIIYISSTSVYGNVSSPVLNEGCPLIADTQYGCSKLEAERILEDVSDISAIALEPTVVLGNISEKEWLTRVIYAMLNNEKVTYTNKSGFFRCVHVDELCKLIAGLLERKNWSGFERILVSCKDSICTDDMMKYIKLLLHSDSILDGTESGIEQYKIDLSKAYSYGYTATDIRYAIRKLCETIKKYKNKIYVEDGRN